MPIGPTMFRPHRARQQQSWASTSTRDQRLSGRALQQRNARIKVRDRFTCQNVQCNVITDQVEVDHRIALANGGTDDDSNLQCLCQRCHAIKSKLESKGRRLEQPSDFPLTMVKAKKHVVKVVADDDEWGSLGLTLVDRCE